MLTQEMAHLHQALAWIIVVGNALVGVWAISSHWLDVLQKNPLWWSLRVAQALVILQVFVGLYLQAVQGDQVSQMHVFYGVVAAIAVGLGVIYALSAEWVQQNRALASGFFSLFLMGLGIRAMVTAAG